MDFSLRRRAENRLAVVLGCGDLGSAIAVALRRSAMSVVLIDEPDPPWHRRGMAFTDAWYVGKSQLEGESACFCASLRSIPSVLSHGLIAATAWSWRSVSGSLNAEVVVDARFRRLRSSIALRGRVPLSIGVGGGLVQGVDVDMAIDPGGHQLDAFAHDDVRLQPLARVDGHDRIRIVGAESKGRFITGRLIGQRVTTGETVGWLDKTPIEAPVAGLLVGLAARGARIECGDPLVEVDPTGDPSCCYGIDVEHQRIGEVVAAAVLRRPSRGSLTGPGST